MFVVFALIVGCLERTGSRGWRFDAGCAAVSVLVSRVGCACTESMRASRAVEAQRDLIVDGSIMGRAMDDIRSYDSPL